MKFLSSLLKNYLILRYTVYAGTFSGQYSKSQPLLKYFTVQSVTELWKAVREESCISSDMGLCDLKPAQRNDNKKL